MTNSGTIDNLTHSDFGKPPKKGKGPSNLELFLWIGVFCAMSLSFSRDHSLCNAVVKGFMNWFYVVYFFWTN